MTIIGRHTELNNLELSFAKPSGQLTVIYGRRRIGKSSLIKQFCKNKQHIYIEGLEGLDTARQINSSWQQVAEQTKSNLRNGVKFENWQTFFYYLTDLLINKKTNTKSVLVLDELQWLAVKRTSLISVLKYFWDNHWKMHNVDLILCGSITSYMINSVIKSKALYGRANQIIHLEGLLPHEVRKFIPGRSIDEVIKYQLVLGSVPKYLEEINPKISFDKNINQLFFLKNSILKDEYERIFYSQFPEYQNYQKIIVSLSNGAKSHSELAKQIKLPSGGGLSRYLKTLVDASFIEHSLKFKFSISKNFEKFYISDPYLSFYFKYVFPNLSLINKNTNKDLFSNIVKPNWAPWLGLAFETFCRRHAMLVADKLGIGQLVTDYGQVIQKKQSAMQIDLAFLRSDHVVTICEIKYYDKKVDTDIIPILETKKHLLKLPRKYTVETALISLNGPTPSLIKSEYLNQYINITDLFKE